MKAYDLVDLIITAHEKESKERVEIAPGLAVEPMLNYTGRMAKFAYRKGFPSAKKTWRYTKHKDRKYCGKFDIRIHDSTGKMEHEVLLKSCVIHLSRESVREIYHGNDPYEIGLEGEALEIGCDIQCAFAEQEINWGIFDFQLSTHFGDPDRKEDDDLLYNAVPRDFFMLYLERCFHEIKENGHSVESVFELAVTPYLNSSREAANHVLWPPISKRRIRNPYRQFIYSSISIRKVERWISPFLDRINKICKSGKYNHIWIKNYSQQKFK